MSAVLDLGSHMHVTNFYRDNGCCPLPTDTVEAPADRLERFREHVSLRIGAPIILVGEAAGWRGARQTGVPFTSPVHIGGTTREASATIVRRALDELALTEDVLLWNACLLHPHQASKPGSNVAPSAKVVGDGLELLREVGSGKLIVAVGRHAEQAVSRILGRGVGRAGQVAPSAKAVSVRHPSFGGASQFRQGMVEVAKHLYL